jgi:hypothetical protein
MDFEFKARTGMVTKIVYKITVKGALDEHWSEWFNGSRIKIEQNYMDGKPQTVLTCRVRDQAELNGIINKLYSLNLLLLSVEISGL